MDVYEVYVFCIGSRNFVGNSTKRTDVHGISKPSFWCCRKQEKAANQYPAKQSGISDKANGQSDGICKTATADAVRKSEKIRFEERIKSAGYDIVIVIEK